MAQRHDRNDGDEQPETFEAHCLECNWSIGPRLDVIEVDDAAGSHGSNANHVTTGPLTKAEAREKGY